MTVTKLFQFIKTVGNILLLNLIFLLSCVLTLGLGTGTALTAMYATFLELKTDDSGYYIRNYFKNFKSNFKETIVIDIVVVLLVGAGYLNFLIINTIQDETFKLIMFCITALILVEIAIVLSFLFPVIAKFEGTFIHQLYVAFGFAHRYIYYSLLFVLMFALSIFLTLYVSLAFLIVVFGLSIYLQSLILKRIWRSYEYEISEI